MSNGTPPDFNALAEQILAYTKVDVAPKNPQPGERMTVETIPGILPFVPTSITGVIPLLTGPTSVIFETLVHVVNFSVRYRVVVDGTTVSSLNLEPLTPASLPDSDPLLATFRLAPPLVPDFKAKDGVEAELVATVKVSVEGNNKEKEVKVPLDVVPIPIPTLLVLTGNNKVFGMARMGSLMNDLSGALNSLNTVLQTLNDVKDVLNWGTVFNAFTGGLGELAGALTSGGPAGFAIEEAPDLDDYNDFDDEADQAFLFGPIGTEVRFYSGEEYNELFAGDDEVTRLKIVDDIGGSTVATGFGFIKDTNWQSSRNWDTDPGDEMDDVESCRFFDPGDPLHPGDSDLP